MENNINWHFQDSFYCARYILFVQDMCKIYFIESYELIDFLERAKIEYE